MSLLDFIKELEGMDKEYKKDWIVGFLDSYDIDYTIHEFDGGSNIIAEHKPIINKEDLKYIGIGSHYDAVPLSPGANDNLSSVMVVLDDLRRLKDKELDQIGVRGFFFDKEEDGCIGSSEYVKIYGVNDMIGVYNMEMVGNGDSVALWNEKKLYEDGGLLNLIECAARSNGVNTYRFPQIDRFLDNGGDHRSFYDVGLKDSFCITCITEEDLNVALKYFSNNPLGVDSYSLREELPLFRNYHKPSDKSEYLTNDSLEMVSDLLFESICLYDGLLSE